jgi:hypothetical protein
MIEQLIAGGANRCEDYRKERVGGVAKNWKFHIPVG